MSALAPERLAEREEAGVRHVTLRVPPGLACFAGHFAGHPLVPGVVELDWAIRELERWIDRELDVAALEALKFRRPLLPGETLVLRLAREAAATFAFQMNDENGPISSGRVRERR